MNGYIRNARPARVNFKTVKSKEDQQFGFKTAVLAGAWNLKENFGFSDEDLKEFVITSFDFMIGIADGKHDAATCNEILKENTGINILEGNGEYRIR